MKRDVAKMLRHRDRMANALGTIAEYARGAAYGRALLGIDCLVEELFDQPITLHLGEIT